MPGKPIHRRSSYHAKALVETQNHAVEVTIVPNGLCSDPQLLCLPALQVTAPQSAEQRHLEEIRASRSFILETSNACDLYLKQLRRLRLLNLQKR